MIKGIGIDIIEIDRIRRAIEKNDKFIDRVFTVNEKKAFEEKNHSPQTIAGYFAAKEAVSKALGTGISNMQWKDIEILKDPSGKPYVRLYNNAENLAYSIGIDKIFISISHSRGNAVALAIAD
ncbi:MAG TPA: holo-ACP synthase [Oscillospiraceae bacterium]|nr:holo-ACP synthase [Oscillospiraceae bacterium]